MTSLPPLDPEPHDIVLEGLAPIAPEQGLEPEADPDLVTADLGQPTPAAPCCYLALEVVQDALDHGLSGEGREVGGLLLGRFVSTTWGEATLVAHLVPARGAVSSSTHVTFGQEQWADMHQQLDAWPDHPPIVGWYHTHPGFGPFYSANDSFIHRNFFTAPLHVGLVVDPHQYSLSLYGWQAGELVRAAGCQLFAPGRQVGELRDMARRLTYISDQTPARPSLFQRLRGLIGH